MARMIRSPTLIERNGALGALLHLYDAVEKAPAEDVRQKIIRDAKLAMLKQAMDEIESVEGAMVHEPGEIVYVTPMASL